MAIKDMEVAAEILRQLGGREFVMMTGAKDFSTINGSELIMTLPRNQSKANRLEITLDNATDTYNMRFYRFSPPKFKASGCVAEKVTEICSYTDVYFDQLRELFTEVTGLDTRMPRIVGINC